MPEQLARLGMLGCRHFFKHPGSENTRGPTVFRCSHGLLLTRRARVHHDVRAPLSVMTYYGIRTARVSLL